MSGVPDPLYVLARKALLDAVDALAAHLDAVVLVGAQAVYVHAELVEWARGVGAGRVGIEGAGNYGRPAATQLLGAGLVVLEVPPQMTAAARRGRRTASKCDQVDALEIARIAVRDDDLPPPRFAGAPQELAPVVDYRRELVKARTAALNRLHSCLEKIRCGYHTRTGPLTAAKGLDAAARLLRGDTSAAAEIARSRIRDIRRLDREIAAFTKRITAAITTSATSLTGIDGIGPLTAAEILTEVGDPARFATKHRFAMANGTAPIEASSGRVVRHRLNRGGNRQLNKALHIAAIAEISRPDTDGRSYYERCLQRGKSKGSYNSE